MIDTTEVTRLAGKFTNLLQDYTDIETKANSTYASITDLVSVTKVSGVKFEQQMAKTKKVLSNTNKWMTEFNSKQGKTQVGFNEILSKQKAELASLNNAVATNESGQVSGIISIGAQKMYQMKDFKKSVKTDHAKVAKLEKSYDNHYHGMKYLWQEYSNTKAGKATSTLVNGKKAVDDYLDNSFMGDVKDRAVNAVSLSKELKNAKEILLGKAGKEGKYGKVGIKTYADLKTALSASKDYIKNGKIGKGIKQSIERIPTSVKDGAVRKVKNVGEFVKKVGRGAEKVNSVWSTLSHPVKDIALKAGKKMVKAKVFSKLGKTISVVAWTDLAIKTGFSAKDAYYDKDSLAYKDREKAAIHGGLDQLKNVGPIQGAVAGAKISKFSGNPYIVAGTIGVGFAFGSINKIADIVAPKAKKKFYKGAEKIADKGLDKIRSVGRAFKNKLKGSLKVSSGGRYTYG
ncbi:hypothetical protein IV66_GL001593 [Ligilactobacillus pobuzihii]|uniref:LXG domain-containing protein n=3 Tax=Ligilactobacillus pobuzihii TaxID=449659 RepID=A0A0R2LCQ0_9LACO|nr:hypothetical protein IV66_GL001593 [Ligilactobacillus pobuzihii]GEN48316.1 hypothetical protein LPO01_11080 [Ligilactobacillus pobuzihii]